MKRAVSLLVILVLLLGMTFGAVNPGNKIFAREETREETQEETQGETQEGTQDNAGKAGDQNVMDNQINIAATDDFGRTIPEITGYKKDRYVGLFYFIWFNFSNPNYPYDVTKLLRTHPDELWDPFDKTGIAPAGPMFYFNEPLFGYYSSADKWVVRKHVELFISAGIDFLMIDLSNDEVYTDAFTTLLETLLEYYEAGFDVPKVCCYTNLNTGNTVKNIYRIMYRTDKYKPLWFYGPYDKPLIIAHSYELTEEYREFFYIRPAQWPGYEYEFYEDGVPYCDLHRPQMTHQNLIGVSVAQHTSYVFSQGLREDPKYKARDDINHGRGYTSKNKKNGDVEAIMRGDNIQEQWDYAISQDPEIIFVTGWNEYATGKRVPEHDDQTVVWFVDSFNTEFSRDIEMTKARSYKIDPETGKYIEEGYGDNFYLQMIQNIRKYKGTSDAEKTVNAQHTVDITSAEAWPEDCRSYRNIALHNEPRNKAGFKQDAADNFTRTVTVTDDSEYVYFRIETEGDITPYAAGKTNWMNLFVRVVCSSAPAWEGYQYVLNRNPGSGDTSLDRYDGNSFVSHARAQMNVSGNIMQIAVKKADIGITGENFSIDFKVADSIEKEDDIMDYYVSGSSMPLGRLSYKYDGGAGVSEKTPVSQSGPDMLLILLIAGGALIIALLVVIIILISKR